MNDEFDVLQDVSTRLERGGFAYMLTGSMAMNFYAQPRMTRDIDIVVELQERDVETIIRLFSPEYYVAREAVAESILHKSLFNLIHQETIIKVDVIVRKSSSYRVIEFERRQKIVNQEISTWIASKEDLIISKLWWSKDSHSEMQCRDVKNLATTGFDVNYVEHWTKELGLSEAWKASKS